VADVDDVRLVTAPQNWQTLEDDAVMVGQVEERINAIASP